MEGFEKERSLVGRGKFRCRSLQSFPCEVMFGLIGFFLFSVFRLILIEGYDSFQKLVSREIKICHFRDRWFSANEWGPESLQSRVVRF